MGVGPPDPEINPFFRAELPTLKGVLGGHLPSHAAPSPTGPSGAAFPVDARLGVSGIPQSGTGQVALLTGHNAPALLGRHFGPWPPVRLRPLLEEESFLRRGAAAGGNVVFANAYPEGYPGDRSPRRVAAPVFAALGARLLDRHHEALAAGAAVASEIVNEGWRTVLGHREIPEIPPERAGLNLAALANRADLTFFAHYHTDFVGHRGDMPEAVRTLERVDRFLSGVTAGASSELAVLVVSDHGNVEDVRSGHTRNPALGLTLGPRGGELARPERLTDVAETVLSYLSVPTDTD